jgi:DNA-binding NarL/FixJ family response regulator
VAYTWKRSPQDIAGDGDSALKLLSVDAYDIAVLDRDIPGPTGDEIARRIVASGSGMPILMLTAADRSDDKACGFELGADDYLTSAPMTASRIGSPRNCVRIWPFVAPRARRRPISERRSSTEMIMMLATPTAPTISATTPSPRKRLSNAPAAAARAVSTSDGWLSFTSFGASGSAVCASSDCAAAS